jgi:hypothetical protein
LKAEDEMWHSSSSDYSDYDHMMDVDHDLYLESDDPVEEHEMIHRRMMKIVIAVPKKTVMMIIVPKKTVMVITVART